MYAQTQTTFFEASRKEAPWVAPAIRQPCHTIKRLFLFTARCRRRQDINRTLSLVGLQFSMPSDQTTALRVYRSPSQPLRYYDTMIDLCCLFFIFAAYYADASPIALPQAVTALISPSAPSPPGCTGSYPGFFGIAVMNISTSTPETSSATLPRRRQDHG